MTIIDAILDENLFRPWFKDLASWQGWLTFLKALFGLPMTEEECTLFRAITGRQTPPDTQAAEAWLVVGRRGGKSFIVALVSVYLACFRSYEAYLQRGERATVMVIATDRRQARVVFRYVRALMTRVPLLADMIDQLGAEEIQLKNAVSIEVHSSTIRGVRGYTLAAAILDEIAFWYGETAANPDYEIVEALRPAMSTIPGSLLIGLSSPYRRAGVLYEQHRRHFGQDQDPVLVVQADTRTMNPTVPQSVIDQAIERDPLSATAEYLGRFRSDVASFLEWDWVDRAIERGRQERPPVDRLDGHAVQYHAFTDASSGSGGDAFSLAIAHREGARLVLDVCRGRHKPFQPDEVVLEFATLLKTYRCSQVTGDRYAKGWVAEAFRRHGITYRESEHTKSELYLEAAPAFAQGAIALLDVKKLSAELMQLERRTSRTGRDSVDHPPAGHDDYANSCCGALVLAAAVNSHVCRMVKLSGV